MRVFLVILVAIAALGALLALELGRQYDARARSSANRPAIRVTRPAPPPTRTVPPAEPQSAAVTPLESSPVANPDHHPAPHEAVPVQGPAGSAEALASPAAGDALSVAGGAAAPHTVRWADHEGHTERIGRELSATCAELATGGGSDAALGAALELARQLERGPAVADVYRAWLNGRPGDTGRRFELATHLLRQGLFSEAMPHLRQVTQAWPEELRGWHNLAVAAQGAGLLQEAESAWTRAIELGPHVAEAYGYRGEVRLDLGDAAGAAADFGLALEAQPEAADVLLNLALARERLGEWEAALRAAREACRLAPESTAALNRAGRLAWQLYELEGVAELRTEAAAWWRQSLAVDAAQPATRGWLWEAEQ